MYYIGIGLFVYAFWIAGKYIFPAIARKLNRGEKVNVRFWQVLGAILGFIIGWYVLGIITSL